MTDDEERDLDVVVRRVADRFPGIDPEHVRAQVLAELDAFDGVPVRDFVPVLVENAVMDTFRASADPTPIVPPDEPA